MICSLSALAHILESKLRTAERAPPSVCYVETYTWMFVGNVQSMFTVNCVPEHVSTGTTGTAGTGGIALSTVLGSLLGCRINFDCRINFVPGMGIGRRAILELCSLNKLVGIEYEVCSRNHPNCLILKIIPRPSRYPSTGEIPAQHHNTGAPTLPRILVQI